MPKTRRKNVRSSQEPSGATVAPQARKPARRERPAGMLVLAAGAWLAAGAALADPCKAIPDKGPLPAFLAPGRTFQGPVAYVGDGDSLCVAVGPSPDQWVEVRLADFYAAELSAPGGRQAKAALQKIVRRRQAVCRADHRSYDRVVARCNIDGISIGDRLRAAGVPEGGNGR